ncbi:MAG: transposase [Myxococcales bacterium]|nr:transposase [Myxococcales bacterium]
MSVETRPPKRSRPLRVESDSHLWFVSCRVIEGRFFLHPVISCGLQPPNHKARRAIKALERHCDKRLAKLVERSNANRGPFQPKLTFEDAKRMARGLIGSALGRAQQHCKVKVFALVVMSNHIHLVVQTTEKNLAAFMAYFKARVADDINLLTGKRGPLWARRYDAEPITDDPSVADRIAYSVDNPCKANLVSEPEEWPGLNLAYGLGDSDELGFEFLNRTKWHKARHPEKLAPFFETVTLKLSAAPSCEGMDRETYRASLDSWIEQLRAKQAAKGHKKSGAPLGVEKVVLAAFETRPARLARSRRPYVFCEPERRAEHAAARLSVSAAHWECSRRYQAGEPDVRFPEGTYPPPILKAA